MPTKPPRNTPINNGQTPVQDYLKMKELREQRLWMVRNGRVVTIYNGEEMEAATFDQLYPLPTAISFNRCTNNVDKTRNYLL